MPRSRVPTSRPDTPSTTRAGAYGLTVDAVDVDGRPAGLQPVPDSLQWPTIEIRVRPANGDRPPAHAMDAASATVLLIEGEHLEADRTTARATYYLRDGWTGHEIVHPYLAGAASVFSAWHGRMAFHGGGVVVDGRVWGVLGRKEAGKTTVLSLLHARGVEIVADDLLVIEDGTTVLAGPRCLDLRPPTMDHLARHAPAMSATRVRDGERYRLTLPPVELRLPFAGWVLLEDGADIEMRGVPARQRFAAVSGEHRVAGHNHRDFLTLLSAPTWVLTRPRAFDVMPTALDLLLGRLGA